MLGNLDMCRLESLGGAQHLGSLGNLPSLGKLGGQRLESLGNLESLGKLESIGQRLESFGQAGDISSNSLDGISRQLLGSLPENDPAIKDMLASIVRSGASSPPQGERPPQSPEHSVQVPNEPCSSCRAACPIVYPVGPSCTTEAVPEVLADFTVPDLGSLLKRCQLESCLARR